ncbi:UDP-N-acetyl-D-mannosamine dehydrogenase [Gammaproteobacteria bacterium]|nr:UDP-N-acetyl-D-mannosamine dehydrogenase [Gammaproteobacteria bacterium]
MFNNISVIGLGYIGLPTAAILASKKKKVIGVDTNTQIVSTINNGKIHIKEPKLEKIVRDSVEEGFLQASLVPVEADAFLIAVPTPFVTKKSQIPQPNLEFVKKAAESIAPFLKIGDLIILESTSPVGTTEQLSQWLSKVRPDLSFPHQKGSSADINVAYCPERVLPGKIVSELKQNDRVIGGMSEKCSLRALELYKIFVEGDCVVTNARTAEMSKLTENSCRDVQIAFANELSVICENLDIDVWELISLANRHPRINILQPGPGVGGHCIAVDPWFIVNSDPENSQIIRTARNVNDAKPDWVINKTKIEIDNLINSGLKTKDEDITIACFGLTFKADIDDLRESPAMRIAADIIEFHKGNVVVVEPNIADSKVKMMNLVGIEEASKNADIGILLVDHSQFKEFGKPNIPIIIDTRGIWS